MKPERARGCRIGVDIGGTFTDAAMVDEATGEMQILKVPSTPLDPAEGFMNALDRLVASGSVAADEVTALIHATTVATNAIIQGGAARTGLITTKGFRDLFEIARQIRPKIYDFFEDKPSPLIPRALACEVGERLDALGTVVEPLNVDEVREAARRLRAEGVEAIVVCFLHAYLNPAHELEAGEVVREEFPEVYLSLSSQVWPEIREYFRASTAAVNACIMPVTARYIDRVQAMLAERGVRGGLYVMQSSGGILAAEVARDKPVYMVESGPAAGVIIASYLGGLLGMRDVISLDMGGTTAKVGLVRDAVPEITTEYEVGGASLAKTSLNKGTGYPIQTPVIDLVEIGAGGGSIAWVDTGGVLRVGPQSAGADPGPACYGKGGEHPTVSDANLLLGCLNADYFLGGEIRLNRQAATDAVTVHCARPLGVDPVAAANGIIEIANANMLAALRLVSVERGYDPRSFTLVAFGGAGPLHATTLADQLGIPLVLIPSSPGVASAIGLLVTDVRRDYTLTRIQRTDAMDLALANDVFRDFEAGAAVEMERQGVGQDNVRLVRTMELRYVGQSYQLRVPIGGGELTERDIHQAVEVFHREHERSYGYCVEEEDTEVVNLKLTATGIIKKPRFKERPQGGRDPAEARKGMREVYFQQAGAFIPCPLYDRYRLLEGNVVEGPAIVEEIDSTTLVLPGQQAETDRYGNLLVTIAG